jgi:hypothetical protein
VKHSELLSQQRCRKAERRCPASDPARHQFLASSLRSSPTSCREAHSSLCPSTGSSPTAVFRPAARSLARAQARREPYLSQESPLSSASCSDSSCRVHRGFRTTSLCRSGPFHDRAANASVGFQCTRGYLPRLMLRNSSNRRVGTIASNSAVSPTRFRPSP